MKFYCDVCNTKYSIADEKVSGKVLKVRCKNCSNIITVREAQTPVEASGSSVRDVPKPPQKASSPPQLPASNWYYSINGQSSGPFELEKLQKRFRSGELGDECYVWHEKLVEWKPVASAPGFADALKAGQQRKPRPKTLGYTGKVQAIKAPSGPSQQREGAVPQTQEKSRPVPTPETARSPSPRNERLEKLRKKLKSDPKPEPQTHKAVSLPEPSKKPVSEPESTAQLTFDSSVEHAADIDTDEAASDSGLPDFGLSPSPKLSEPTSSTSDILDASDERQPLPMGLGDDEPALEPEAVEDSGVIPFFPDAPKLESAGAPPTGQSQTTTGSLLIQLQDIQREGRGKAVALVTVAALVVGGLIATAITISILNQGDKPDEIASATPAKTAPRELKERRYSKSELERFGALTLEEEVISREDAQEEGDPEESQQDGEGSPEPPPQKVAQAEAEQRSADPVGAVAPPSGEKKASDEAKKQEEAPAGAASGQAQVPPKEADTKPKTARERLLGYSSGSSKTTINRPEDRLTAKAELPNTLQKDDARKGFRRIRSSVMTCRERFLRRGGRFDQPKIEVTVVIQPNGEVTKISTTPSTLSGTEFDRCMQSHRSRWRFAQWDGVPTEVSSSYVLQ